MFIYGIKRHPQINNRKVITRKKKASGNRLTEENLKNRCLES
jgi:hypothetical protein